MKNILLLIVVAVLITGIMNANDSTQKVEIGIEEKIGNIDCALPKLVHL